MRRVLLFGGAGLAAAIDHGRYRGNQGGTWELLLFELTFLSDALRIAVRGSSLPPTVSARRRTSRCALW